MRKVAQLIARLALILLLVLSALPAIAQDGARPAGSPSDPPPAAPEAPRSTPPPVTDPSAPGQVPASAPAPTLEELQRQLQVLAAEVEKLRSGEEEEELTPERRRALGLSPSAAATYRKQQGVSFAGYGEALFENYAAEDERGRGTSEASQFDFLRAVLYAGYRFNERFVFNSEVEFEHGGEEVGVEFAYLDYLIADALTIRGGLVLLPMGLTNEFHESNVYLGARRPETERRILPSTWRENGVGVLGSRGALSYRAYVVNGMNAAGFDAAGLRGGRQEGIEAKASDFAVVGRLDVTPLAGLFVGGSIYTGGADQGEIDGPDGPVSVNTTIGEVHGQAQVRGFDLRGLFAAATVTNAGDLNRALDLEGTNGVGHRQHGGYVQLGYNVLSQHSTSLALTPYYRFEHVNTQASMPEGFLADPAQDQQYQTLGVELRPIYNIVVKTEYQWITNGAQTGRNQFNVNMGYAF